MFNQIKIGTKITILLLGVVLLSVFAIGALAYQLSKESIEKRYLENLQVINIQKAQQLETIFKQLEYNLGLIQNSNRVLQSLLQANEIRSADSAYLSIERRLNDYLVPIQDIYDYENILLLDHQGRIIYRTKKDLDKTEELVGEIFRDYEQVRERASQGIYYGNLYKTSETAAYINVAAPVLDLEDRVIGHVVTEFKMEKAYQTVNDTTGLGKTGEIILSRLGGNKLDYLNRHRLSRQSLLSQTFIIDEDHPSAMQLAAQPGQSGYGYTNEMREREVKTLAVWRNLPRTNWGLVVKIDANEIEQELNLLLGAFLFAGVLIVLLAFSAAYIFSRLLIRPLLALKANLDLVAQGILPRQVAVASKDEIGEMASAVNNLVGTLKTTTDFAYRIGAGDYEAEYKPVSQDDMLGNALTSMRDNIQASERKDNDQNWIISGVAEVGQVLRSYNRIDDLGEHILAYVTDKIGAVQGAFYVLEEAAEPGQPVRLQMRASRAYQKKKHLTASFRLGEGLVGQAAIERDTILRTEVPDRYPAITSGLLGDRRPKCLLLVPLITDEQVCGVMEFAGFTTFTPVQVRFVQEISLSIARTISNIWVNERTVRLLQESQQMSEELQFQQEVLRSNAEIMESTQEELRRTNHRLEDQVQEVNRSQKRMQLLLENASEVITIYEEDGYIRYISPSVERILGHPADEMIGINDIIHVHADSVARVQKMFRQLLADPAEQVTIQIEYLRANGETIWLESTGTNLLRNPAIQGILVNSRDITERRLAEQEARMRGQMQALSENSPDLITRLTPAGAVFYINPAIREITGLSPEVYLGKNLKETPLHPDLIKDWLALMQETLQKNTVIKTELTYHSINGERIVQVNAIPEQNEQQETESVLLVSHDITERKEAETEILNINRKITESINYAKRIQGAILPDTATIRTALPESFIYYKPRDVVSGDFPWFAQRDNDIFIAAVDCTGHGVPGALISLIGFFILNDVINSTQATDPGQILDLLNDGVTKTLRQDVASVTRDGMDIALCRINLVTRELQYAGAHRPLYYVREGELTQLKGDRFPIGGGQLKNRDNFATSTMQIAKGDAVYLFSDGLPDQFGPDMKKFSPRQIRDIVVEHHDKPIQEVRQAIDDAFETWRGNLKQTDDILLIGIKF
jgi:PAS domain S-box-containing protein